MLILSNLVDLSFEYLSLSNKRKTTIPLPSPLTFLDRRDFQYLEVDINSAYSGWWLVGRAGQAWQESQVFHHSAPVVSLPRHTGAPHLRQRQTGPLQSGMERRQFCGSCCKGISNKLNDPQREVYLKVLQTWQSRSGENRGFSAVDNKVLTYAQHWTGFS